MGYARKVIEDHIGWLKTHIKTEEKWLERKLKECRDSNALIKKLTAQLKELTEESLKL